MNMEAIIYKHGTDDFELWQLDLPKEAMDLIETILDQYRDTGCSVRGTGLQIGYELKEI